MDAISKGIRIKNLILEGVNMNKLQAAKFAEFIKSINCQFESLTLCEFNTDPEVMTPLMSALSSRDIVLNLDLSKNVLQQQLCE